MIHAYLADSPFDPFERADGGERFYLSGATAADPCHRGVGTDHSDRFDLVYVERQDVLFVLEKYDAFSCGIESDFAMVGCINRTRAGVSTVHDAGENHRG